MGSGPGAECVAGLGSASAQAHRTPCLREAAIRAAEPPGIGAAARMAVCICRTRAKAAQGTVRIACIGLVDCYRCCCIFLGSITVPVCGCAGNSGDGVDCEQPVRTPRSRSGYGGAARAFRGLARWDIPIFARRSRRPDQEEGDSLFTERLLSGGCAAGLLLWGWTWW